MQLLVNAFGVFRAFYRIHFSHDFGAQGVTLKSKALATKCIFQHYSQLLDICTAGFKTAEELFVPSVYVYINFSGNNAMLVCLFADVTNAIVQKYWDEIRAGKRPPLDKSVVPASTPYLICQLIQECWEQDPKNRPKARGMHFKIHCFSILRIVKYLNLNHTLHAINFIVLMSNKADEIVV